VLTAREVLFAEVLSYTALMAAAKKSTTKSTTAPKTSEQSSMATEKFWRDSEITSDSDVERDTYTPSRQRDLLAKLRERRL
jgi:hypothetical protein